MHINSSTRNLRCKLIMPCYLDTTGLSANASAQAKIEKLAEDPPEKKEIHNCCFGRRTGTDHAVVGFVHLTARYIARDVRQPTELGLLWMLISQRESNTSCILAIYFQLEYQKTIVCDRIVILYDLPTCNVTEPQNGNATARRA